MISVCTAARRLASLLVLILTLFAFIIFPDAALAQWTPSLTMDVGRNGRYTLRRLNAVKVDITWSSSAPGLHPQGAPAAYTLVLNAPRDSFYEISISASVTLTPGIPSDYIFHTRTDDPLTDGVRVKLYESGGKLVAAARSNAMLITNALSPDQLRVLVVGRSSLSHAGWVWGHASSSVIELSEVSAEQFPRTWEGLDDIGIIVVGSLDSSSLDSAQTRTLLEWVQQGGDLVVTAVQETAFLASLLRETGLSVNLGHYAPADISDDTSLESAIKNTIDDHGVVLRLRSYHGDYNPVESPQEQQDLLRIYDSINHSGHNRVYRRMFSASPQDGWMARDSGEAFDHHHLDHFYDGRTEGLKADPAAPDADPIVQGDILVRSAGLGTLTILGMDPVTLNRSGNSEVDPAAWLHVLAHLPRITKVISDVASPATHVNRGNYLSSYGTWVGGMKITPGNNYSTDAVMLDSTVSDTCIDMVSQGLAHQEGLFTAVAMSLLLVVLLIGPVDYILLKKLNRQPLTWITAPAVVIIFCMLIILAQEAVGRHSSELRRIAVLDVVPGLPLSRISAIDAVAAAHSGVFTVAGGDVDHAALFPVSYVTPYDYYFGRSATGDSSSRELVPMEVRGQSSVLTGLPMRAGMTRWIDEHGFVPAPTDVSAVIHVPQQGSQSHAVSSDCTIELQLPEDQQTFYGLVRIENEWYGSDLSGTLSQHESSGAGAAGNGRTYTMHCRLLSNFAQQQYSLLLSNSMYRGSSVPASNTLSLAQLGAIGATGGHDAMDHAMTTRGGGRLGMVVVRCEPIGNGSVHLMRNGRDAGVSATQTTIYRILAPVMVDSTDQGDSRSNSSPGRGADGSGDGHPSTGP